MTQIQYERKKCGWWIICESRLVKPTKNIDLDDEEFLLVGEKNYHIVLYQIQFTCKNSYASQMLLPSNLHVARLGATQHHVTLAKQRTNTSDTLLIMMNNSVSNKPKI